MFVVSAWAQIAVLEVSLKTSTGARLGGREDGTRARLVKLVVSHVSLATLVS